ncbi:unnamed protein product (macronuclear) [Paramecium tetraurelia]|uniref:HSF-type DNA-binding domain-containing protein n=1 Tax=Paramecium tetraurelia TaxID=5888 RepID=A0CTK1_PARTE|nr:uncharacterized protein GSPATT00010352001 [Paramecium tetraurelia]CAK74118.1 unnamed protein product [Paramecium tetraurelia]|eukprot:XP_001441515.1 hypothetical protein (macronuclear) [Paramecium tetraurelia strain d4-2]
MEFLFKKQCFYRLQYYIQLIINQCKKRKLRKTELFIHHFQNYFIKFWRLSKLIIQNQEYDNIIRWNDFGDKFMILDKPTFIQKILPKYFRHQKFSSFLRQLNLYGFLRVCTERNNSCYYNLQFNKQSPNLQMKKKQRPSNSYCELETSALRNQMNQIKMTQQILKQQIDGCLQSVDKMTSLTQYLINVKLSKFIQLLFESKIQTSNQAKSILNTTVKLYSGMLPQFFFTFQELLEITFPSSEILQLENAISYFNKSPIMPQVHIQLLQIFNYLSSYYPATQFSKYNEAFSNIEKSYQNLEDFAYQRQQLRIQD